jgi:hypothetical protein
MNNLLTGSALVIRGTFAKGRFVLPLLLTVTTVVSMSGIFILPQVAHAATLLTDSFGTGSTNSDVPNWDENGSGTEARAFGGGEDSTSTDGGRFALIDGNGGWICRAVDAGGYNSLQLSYYWRGDLSANDASDDGIVEYKASGNCTDANNTWTGLQNHDLRSDALWTTQTAFSLPVALNNSSFLLRFRAASNSTSDDFRVDGILVSGTAVVVHTITATAGAGGTITPSGSVSVNDGASSSFIMVPLASNIVVDATVDTISQGALNAYNFTNVTADRAISASFEGGWNAPSAVSDTSSGGGNVSGEANAYASDNSYATFDNPSDQAEYRDFGFSVSSGATIDGIRIALEGNKVNRTLDVSLSWNGGTSWTTGSGTGVKNTGSLFSTSDKTIILGGSTDVWNRTWSASDFSNGNFRVRLHAVSSGLGDTVNIDQLQVKVHYTLPAQGSISGQKFSDTNLNWAKDAGEPGLSGWTINLYSSNNPWTLRASTATDQSGNYAFSQLADGTYFVCEVPQSGWYQVYPTQGVGCGQDGTIGYTVTVSGGATYQGKDFGNVAGGHIVVHKVTHPADTGTQFSVTMYRDDQSNFGTKTVVGGGTATWDVYPRGYSVTEDAVAGWTQTSNGCSNLQVGAGQTVDCTIENTKLGSITVTKYADPDGQFQFDATGFGTMYLSNGQSVLLDNITPGSVTITETVPEGWTGIQHVDCSDGTTSEQGSVTVAVAAGDQKSCTFNNTQDGVIAGQKFNDMAANGVRNESDRGLSGWTINLYRHMTLASALLSQVPQEWTYVDTRTTDQGGYYSFGNLTPSEYRICEVNQPGWTQSYPVEGVQCSEGTLGYDVSLSAGQTIDSANFGNWAYGSISGMKFNDLDGDSLGPNEGDEEPGIAGWTFELYQGGEGWQLVSSQQTADDGSFTFTGLRPGVDYKVSEVMREEWRATMPNGQGYYTVEPMTSGWTITKMDFGNQLVVVDSPIANPGSGKYDVGQAVMLTASASTIRYTVGDGSNAEPTCSTGDLYTNPISVTQDSAIRAVACVGTVASPVANFHYMIGERHSGGGSFFPEVLGESTSEPGGGATFPSSTASTTGAVLGESTSTLPVLTEPSCGAYLTSYLWYGKKNDGREVTKLQQFLNDKEGNTLPVTGYFGTLTRDAVKLFQSKYAADILTPWGETKPTGNVYKTTKWKINTLWCSTLGEPAPIVP